MELDWHGVTLMLVYVRFYYLLKVSELPEARSAASTVTSTIQISLEIEDEAFNWGRKKVYIIASAIMRSKLCGVLGNLIKN